MESVNCYKNKKDDEDEIISNKPQLICFYESGNEEQKEYCIKLKDNFKHEKTINYEIESIPKVPFGIKIAYNNKIQDLQKEFDDSEDAMFETLRKAYQFLAKI